MMNFMEEDAGRTQKKPSWKSPERVLTSPNVFGRMSRQNWSFLVHPHPLTFYRRKNEALKENLEPVQGTSLKTTQASWSETYCRVSESSACVRGHGLKNTRMAEAKNWLFLNGSPWAQSLSQPKDLRENLKIAVLRRHPDTAWAARWGKVGQTTCWQMQTSHCELQRSLIGNDIKLRVPSFLSILIL